jgi:hippurate hydrolase
MPDDRMPVVTTREAEATPATFNTAPLTTETAALLTQRFGAGRVKATPPVMGGEDFSRFYLADKSIQSLIFWVGGVPEAKWQAANGDPAKLPSLHSPFWAPDAERTISTATEAMTAAALGVLRKS